MLGNLPDEFLTWWTEIGGSIEWIKTYTRTKEIPIPQLRYNKGRPSHKLAGNDEYLVRFRGEDSNTALMLLIKWSELVISHNMREIEQMKEANYD